MSIQASLPEGAPNTFAIRRRWNEDHSGEKSHRDDLKLFGLNSAVVGGHFAGRRDAASRVGADDRTVHRMQAEPQREAVNDRFRISSSNKLLTESRAVA